MTVLGYVWDGVSVDFGSHRLDGKSHVGRYSRDAPKNDVVRMVRVRPRRYTREAPHNGGVRENGGKRGPGY